MGVFFVCWVDVEFTFTEASSTVQPIGHCVIILRIPVRFIDYIVKPAINTRIIADPINNLAIHNSCFKKSSLAIEHVEYVLIYVFPCRIRMFSQEIARKS